MAKPAETPDIWASDTLYIVGPKSGLPTKVSTASPIAAANQGHIPGKDFPTTANEFNLWCFEISKVAGWTMEGSSLPDLTAHLVETDSDGEAELARAIVGGTLAAGPSLTVLENNTGQSALIKGTTNTALQLETNSSPNFLFARTLLSTSDCTLDTTPGNSFAWQLTSTPDSPNEGPGGLGIQSDGLGNDTNGQFWATLRADNVNGIAGIFESSIASPHGTLEANNTATQGTALFIGRTAGKGMIGVRVIAGEGDPVNNKNGGTGGLFFGGAGKDGTFDTDGGVGLFATGGSAEASGTPAIGAEIKSGGAGAASLVLRHVEELNQTQPLLSGITGENIGGGITMVCEGSGHGARLETQAGDGIRLLKSETGAALMGVHMYLQPIINKDVNVTISDGDLWLTRNNVAPNDYFDLRIKCNPTRFIPMFTNPVVYGYEEKSGQTSSVSVGVPVVAVTPSLGPELAPTISGAVVIVTVKCWATAVAFTGPIVGIGQIVFTDDTAASVEHTYQLDLVTPAVRVPVAYSFEYTLPASGARDFSLGIEKLDADPTSVSIGGVSVEIRTKWGQ